MRRYFYLVACLVLISVGLSSCRSYFVPRAASMIPEMEASEAAMPGSALYHGIVLTHVTGGEATELLGPSQVGNEEFGEALSRTLDKQNFLSAAGNAPFRLKVNIAYVKSTNGNSMMNSAVRYTLTRSKDGVVVFDEVIRDSVATEGRAPGPPAGLLAFGIIYPILGVNRLRENEEAAMRANISSFLTRLHAALAEK